METPKYIISALRGAEFYFGENCVPGYSIKIRKRTKYEYANTLRSRCPTGKSCTRWLTRSVMRSPSRTRTAMLTRPGQPTGR